MQRLEELLRSQLCPDAFDYVVDGASHRLREILNGAPYSLAHLEVMVEKMMR